MSTRTFIGLPSPFNNPTLEGYDILATSPPVAGAHRDTTVRALVVRYTDHPDDNPHILWQEWSSTSKEWRYQPGSNASECETLIMALMGAK